jgi:hypothetical protein
MLSRTDDISTKSEIIDYASLQLIQCAQLPSCVYLGLMTALPNIHPHYKAILMCLASVDMHHCRKSQPRTSRSSCFREFAQVNTADEITDNHF